MQEAEAALGACIQDPIFHRVRDVAPNKVPLRGQHSFVSFHIFVPWYFLGCLMAVHFGICHAGNVLLKLQAARIMFS